MTKNMVTFAIFHRLNSIDLLLLSFKAIKHRFVFLSKKKHRDIGGIKNGKPHTA